MAIVVRSVRASLTPRASKWSTNLHAVPSGSAGGRAPAFMFTTMRSKDFAFQHNPAQPGRPISSAIFTWRCSAEATTRNTLSANFVPVRCSPAAGARGSSPAPKRVHP